MYQSFTFAIAFITYKTFNLDMFALCLVYDWEIYIIIEHYIYLPGILFVGMHA